MYSPRRGNQVSGGVFLIGLGLMFANILPWFPGIMFVIGAASIAQGIAEGRGWYALQGGLWMIGLGLLFSVGFSLPLLFILIGISTLLGVVRRPSSRFGRNVQFGDEPVREKRKNDQPLDAYDEAEDEDRYVLGDDGEMVKAKNDQKRLNT